MTVPMAVSTSQAATAATLLLHGPAPRQPNAKSQSSVNSTPIVSALLLILAFVIACTIGVARIYVGVHYPGDILGGAIDGLIAALIVTLLRRWLSQPTFA